MADTTSLSLDEVISKGRFSIEDFCRHGLSVQCTSFGDPAQSIN